MIVDSSAIVAMIKGDPEGAPFAETIAGARQAVICAANYFEAGIVIDRNPSPVVRGGLDALLRELNIAIAPVTADQARLARQAYRDFGKGSGHPARLNFGDCFAYALAMDRGEPLLFKGDDFGHTGVERALA